MPISDFIDIGFAHGSTHGWSKLQRKGRRPEGEEHGLAGGASEKLESLNDEIVLCNSSLHLSIDQLSLRL